MALTLVTGRANAGKTGRVYDLLEHTVRTGGRAVLLLPTQPEVTRATREFAWRAVVGLTISTVDSWLAGIWEEVGDGRRLVTDSSRLLAVRDALADATRASGPSVGSTPGYIRFVADLVRESAGLDLNPRTTGGRALAHVLERYREAVTARGLVEIGDVVGLLASAPPKLADLIVANRFADLSAAQERLLVSLSTVTDVRIVLPWEEGFPATRATDLLVDRLLPRGVHVHVDTHPPQDELQGLENVLFRPEAGLVRSQGCVLLAEASGEEAEVALIADLVAEAIADGANPGSVAVAFRDAARRAEPLATQLSQRGINADADVALPLASTGFGRAFLALLDVCSERGETRERVLAFLQTPYAGLDYDSVTRLDGIWRRQRSSSGEMIRDVQRQEGACAGIVTRTLGLCRKGLSRQNSGDLRDLLGDLLGAAHASPDRQGDIALDAAAHRCVLAAAEELLSAGFEPCSMSDLRDSVVHRPVVLGRADRADAVQITEATRIRSRRFDVVVLGGLTSDEFSPERDFNVLGGRLAELGVPVERDERLAERLLFYLATTRAHERLMIVRQVADSEGRPRRPSAFWDDVRVAYGETPGDEESEAVLPRRRRSMAEIAITAPAFAPGRQDVRAGCRRRGGASEWGLDASIRAELAATREFAVTELEVYAACPRRWFYVRAISPREIDTRFDARASGALAHRALAEFYTRWRAAGHSRVTEESLAETEIIAEESLDAVHAVQPVGLAEALALAETRVWVRAAVTQDARLFPGFEPIAHEFDFGEDAGRPVDLGDEVLVRGRIDRIDCSRDRAIVTDYKSHTARGWRSFGDAGLLQVPVYAHAAETVLGTSVVGGVYRSLARGTLRGFWDKGELDLCAEGGGPDGVTAQELDEIVTDAIDTARVAALGIRAGRAPVAPRSALSCKYCIARTVCEASR